MLGHDRVGSGARRVIVLNDWVCDTSTWDGARAYLDDRTFTWVLADLRGYGRSMDQSGRFELTEAASDVLALANELGFERFTLVGHSMSCLVALHLGQHHADRIDRVVALTPPPPRGFGADDATVAALQAVGLGDDERRRRALGRMWGDRLSETWMRFKLERWRARSRPEAVAGYVPMFARHGLPDAAARIVRPVLAVTGDQDAEIMRKASVTELLAPLCPDLELVPLQDSGHYPMQETPPLLAAVLERFMGRG